MKHFYLSFVACLSVIICLAQAGTLDSTFATAGFFRANNKSFSSAAIQSDNKFVVAGSGFPYRPGDFEIYRFTPEGLPHATFGTAGTARATVGGNSGVRKVLIQQDGKILVLGESRVAWTTGTGVIATTPIVRLTANGLVDETFGDHGFVKIVFGNATSVYAGQFSMALQQDGKILVCGPDYTISNNTFSLWRFNADGSIDNSFATNGRVIRSAGIHSFSTRVVVQTDNKIVFLGATTEFDRFVARYLPSGMPDLTFNGTGTYAYTGQGTYTDALIQPDGKILAAIDLGNSFYMQRINSNGTPDNAFGLHGLITSTFSLPVYTHTVDLQENGKIIVGGSYAPNPGAFGYGMALARYLPSGTLDTTFGTSGVVMKYLGYSTGGAVIGVTSKRIYMLGSGSETSPIYMNYGVIASFKVAEPPPPCENDTLPPSVNCGSDLVFGSVSSNIYSIPTLLTSDNCGVKSIHFSITGATVRNGTGDNATGTFNTGVSFINWQVADSSNNITTCKTKVTVRPPSSTAMVTVPGTANPWLAGMPDGTEAAFGDVAPINSPVKADITLAAASWLEFSNVTGGVSHGFYPLVGPDGCQNAIECQFESFIISHDVGAEYGKSNLTAPINSLVGVFLDNNIPADPAPSALDFASVPSRDYTELRPALKQIFFIGDGKTSGGIQQKIFIPANATRLFLGTMDGIEWNNNNGSFSGTINIFGSATGNRCGNNNEKVLVCHKGQTLCISESAVPAHLKHGDIIGACTTADKLKKRGVAHNSVIDQVQPLEFSVSNFPNPANSVSYIQYKIPSTGNVLITVFDAVGRRVAMQSNINRQAGIYLYEFKTGGLSKGLYYYQVQFITGSKLFSENGKMMIK